MYEINIIENLVENQESYIIEKSITGTPIVVSNTDFYISISSGEQNEGVLYTPQSKTSAEKAIARNNIDAVAREAGKGLSENNFSREYKNNVDANTESRHTHTNLDVLETIKLNELEQIGINEEKIDDILDKIPSQASYENKLADKDFVNSSINSVTADYITSNAAGEAFNTKSQLLSGPYYNKGSIVTLSKNDYTLVKEDETNDGATVRYVYDGEIWAFQYKVNSTAFTAEQLAVLNSGITKEKADKIPEDYVKSASVNDDTLTLTTNKNTHITFKPKETDLTNLVKKDASNLSESDINVWKELLGTNNIPDTSNGASVIIRRWE